MELAGAPVDVLEAARSNAGGRETGDFEVFSENWETLLIFLDLETSWCWLTPPMSEPFRAGLPASEIESALRLNSVRKSKRKAIAQDLRAMERAAMEHMAKGQ